MGAAMIQTLSFSQIPICAGRDRYMYLVPRSLDSPAILIWHFREISIIVPQFQGEENCGKHSV